MTTTDRIHTDPDAAAAVIDAAERLASTYCLDLQNASFSDVITHMTVIHEDIHALLRAVAAFHAATEPPAAEDRA
jgi:predicted ATP-grasp superfamily ATP-dependent carboligase